MHRKNSIVIAVLSLMLFVAGCGPTLGHQNATTREMRCRPVIKTYPSILGDKVMGLYEDLVLDDGHTHFEVMLWSDYDAPAPVALNTNTVYTFRIVRRPDWDGTFYGAAGATRPAGVLLEIILDSKVIWKDTFFTELLEKSRLHNKALENTSQ